jgi:anti-sigma B factor antagonist
MSGGNASVMPHNPGSAATYSHSRVLDGIICLSVAGEIDLANALEFSAQLNVAAEGDGHGVILDLHELRYIDSSGIKVILKTQEIKHIILVAAMPSVARIITLMGVDQVLPMVPTVEEAVRKLSACARSQ